MKLLKTLSFCDMDFYSELAKNEGMIGQRLNDFLDRLNLSRDVYEVKYFKDEQGRKCRKYFLNDVEVERSSFSELALTRIKRLDHSV